MMTEEQVKAKIAEATKQRDALIEQANREIAFLNGQLAALSALIEPDVPAVSKD